MNRTIAAVAAGLVATLPAMAQPASDGAVPSSRQEIVPLQLSAGQIKDLQGRLDRQGFQAGHVDGLWGPDTSAAVRRFQESRRLRATGQFDDATLAALGASSIAATLPAAPPATVARRAPASAPGTASAPLGGTPGAADRTLGTNATGTNPGAPNAGVNAAGGNGNQAVATTSANAPQPAHGANSFSQGEAQRRIEREGFASVAGLKKEDDGVWRGTATKDGASVGVWLDYKGNVGRN